MVGSKAVPPAEAGGFPSLGRVARWARLSAAPFLAFLLLVAACGSDEGPTDTGALASASVGVTFAPGQTKAATPTPAAARGNETPPPLASPILDEAITKIGEGAVSVTILPGESYGFDPLGFPLEPGKELPPCAAFVFAFTWQVSDPYPAGNLDLVWWLNRQGGRIEIARGASGEQGVGCGYVEATNNTQSSISLDMRYLIGAAPQA